MLDPRDDPSTPSADAVMMAPTWQLISDIRCGSVRIKAPDVAKSYLPKYQSESIEEYKRRLQSAPWRPEFVDALRNLCSKPFTKPVSLQGDNVPQNIKDFSEDVDGQGNNLHVFARDRFADGVAMGVSGIYVTWPDAGPANSQAEEKQAGLRPYWVALCADDILACYTKKVGGRDVIQHIRWKECVVTQDKFAEAKSERVRVIELNDAGFPQWTLYEKQQVKGTQDITWVKLSDGVLTIKEIPVVLFYTGERYGNFAVRPPLADLAVMQIEIYRALSLEDEILTYAGSPMLKAVGMAPPQPTAPNVIVDGHDVVASPPVSQVTVGPKTVLYAPPSADGVQPDWDFIQPNAANIAAVQASANNKIEHFRRLALQPETAASGRMTATSAAIDAAKAHSAIEVWATGMQDVLEQAFVYTCMWLKQDATIEVAVNVDFGVDIEGFDEYSNLINMNKNGVLSRQSLWDEGLRRGILGPQFDPEEEEQQIAEEQQGLEPEAMTNPVNGQPVQDDTAAQAA